MTISGSMARMMSGEATAPVLGTVMRNNSPVMIAPEVSNSVANVAISTIGSFFG